MTKNKIFFHCSPDDDIMLRRHPKKITSALLLSCTSFAIYSDYNKKFNIDLEKSLYPISKYLSGQIRSLRCGLTAASIIIDYKLNGINSQIHQNSANKLLHLCKHNKGTYVKVGQHVGALDMLLPEEYVKTMKCLFSEAPESPFSDVEKVLKEDLGIENLNEVFSSIDENPIGSASLAQVHIATLKNFEDNQGKNQKVAVKVQHRRVYESAHRDVEIMDIGLNFAKLMFPEFRLEWLVTVTKRNIFRELDFSHEFENTNKANEYYGNHKNLKDWLIIPKCYKEFSTKRILTMEFKEGVHIDKLPSVTKDQFRLERAISRLQKLYGEMLFKKGFIHCDPHPGNILVTHEDGSDKIVLLDHGLYSQVSSDFTYNFSALWHSLILGKAKGVKKHCEFFNIKGKCKNKPEFEMYELFGAMLMNADFRETIEKKVLQNTNKQVDRDFEKGKAQKMAKVLMYWLFLG